MDNAKDGGEVLKAPALVVRVPVRSTVPPKLTGKILLFFASVFSTSLQSSQFLSTQIDPNQLFRYTLFYQNDLSDNLWAKAECSYFYKAENEHRSP